MSKKIESKLRNVRLIYHKPKLHFLGSIRQVQSYYRGAYIEGEGSRFWYS